MEFNIEPKIFKSTHSFNTVALKSSLKVVVLLSPFFLKLYYIMYRRIRQNSWTFNIFYILIYETVKQTRVHIWFMWGGGVSEETTYSSDSLSYLAYRILKKIKLIISEIKQFTIFNIQLNLLPSQNQSLAGSFY